jgi:hypothetical protein
MNITGAHSIVYSRKPDADRAFFRDVLKLPHVDVGDGWLIFGLPPSEVAFHPSRRNNVHEFYLLCDNVKTLIARLRKQRIKCTKPVDRGYGVFTTVTLPGGGRLSVYQPRHARPKGRSRSRK